MYTVPTSEAAPHPLYQPQPMHPTPLTPPYPDRFTSSLPGRRCQRFSMGYRQDCDKCRMRLPGHYAHIL